MLDVLEIFQLHDQMTNLEFNNFKKNVFAFLEKNELESAYSLIKKEKIKHGILVDI